MHSIELKILAKKLIYFYTKEGKNEKNFLCIKQMQKRIKLQFGKL